MRSAFKRGAIAPVVKASPSASPAALLRPMVPAATKPVVDTKAEAKAAYEARLKKSAHVVMAILTRSGTAK